MNYRPDHGNPQPIGLAIDCMAVPDRDIQHLLGPQGPLSQMPGYQDRPQQRTLAATIRRAWKQGLPAIVEGPTGSGKSASNIVVAVLHALETNRPVVISTHTTALQAQYVNHDLPLLHELLTPWLEQNRGRTFTFASLYGRARYLCEKKAATADLNLDEWRDSTVDGVLDLVLSPHDRRQLTAEKAECPGARCSIAKDGGCWFYAARKRAWDADLLVVNHALLMAAALAQPGTVLPQWSGLIVDEAHTLEEIARQARGVTLTGARVEKLVGQALEFCGEHRQGMLAEANSPEIPDSSASTPTPEGISHVLAALFRSIEHATRRDARDGTALLPALEATAAADPLDEIVAQLGRLASDVRDAGEMHWEESQEAAQANVLRESLEDVAGELHSLRGGRAGQVSWVQYAREKQGAAIHAQSLDVSAFLKDALWKQAPAALSSATLATIGQDPFAYIKDTLGCRTPHAVQVPSPFDWGKQCWLYTPEEGMLESLLGLKVRSAHEREACAREYARVAAMHIQEVLRFTKGRAFLLFTSRTQLELTAGFLADMPWPYITQGEMGQAETVEWFRNTEGAVLFALASYWEGVSVPGSALSCVYIDRIPLPPPTDLLHEARLRAAGGGVRAFREVSLPQAITRLKQGFGRLIRTRTDRGLVVLADPRFRTKDYGRAILDALPPARRIERAHLRHVPFFLAAAGEPVPGDPLVAQALRRLGSAEALQGVPHPDHRRYVQRLAERLAGGDVMPQGLWTAGAWLANKYQNVSERT